MPESNLYCRLEPWLELVTQYLCLCYLVLIKMGPMSIPRATKGMMDRYCKNKMPLKKLMDVKGLKSRIALPGFKPHLYHLPDHPFNRSVFHFPSDQDGDWM